MHRYLSAALWAALFPFFLTCGEAAAAATVVRLGYFEAGEDPLNYVLRDEIQRQLTNASPPDTQFVFVPEGYRSAAWIRDSSRIKAAELAKVGSVDIVVAVGPWVVGDLLAAGYRKPILGVRQIDLLGAGLVTKEGNPVARNLTVHEMPGKIEDDINVFSRLVPIKKLGVLWFDSGDAEQDSILARIDRAARRLGIETVTADGYNTHGTFAFFKALASLPADIDALYVGPLWGMTITEINEFIRTVNDRDLPLMTWEGKFLVMRGAFATNYAFSLVSEAHFHVLKLLSLARGEIPADLSVLYRGGSSLAINLTTAERLGVDVPADALLSGDVVASPVPEGAEWYSLADAEGRAISSNPGYLATYDAIEAAARGARAVSAQYWPQLALEASAGWVDDHTLNNTIEPLKNDQYRASLVLDQPVFSLETLRARKIAAAHTRLAEVGRRQARSDLELAVASAYLGHLRAIEELAVEKRYRELVERTLEFVASEFYLRQQREPDLLRWQDERQSVITRVSDAENAAATSRVLLNLLLNFPPEKALALDSGLVADRSLGRHYDLLAPLAVKAAERERFESWLVDQARAESPLLARESVDRDLGQARLDAGRAARWPTLHLRAAFNLVDQIDDRSGIIDEQTDTWSVFGQLHLPLYLGGAGGHERARLKAELNEVEYRRDAALLSLYGAVRRETGALLSRLVAWPRADRSVELALPAMSLVVDEYEAGRRDMSAMIDAYTHARDVELAEIAARYGYQLAVARLVHDVGWSPSANVRTFSDEFLTRIREPLGR